MCDMCCYFIQVHPFLLWSVWGYKGSVQMFCSALFWLTVWSYILKIFSNEPSFVLVCLPCHIQLVCLFILWIKWNHTNSQNFSIFLYSSLSLLLSEVPQQVRLNFKGYVDFLKDNWFSIANILTKMPTLSTLSAFIWWFPECYLK